MPQTTIPNYLGRAKSHKKILLNSASFQLTERNEGVIVQFFPFLWQPTLPLETDHSMYSGCTWSQQRKGAELRRLPSRRRAVPAARHTRVRIPGSAHGGGSSFTPAQVCASRAHSRTTAGKTRFFSLTACQAWTKFYSFACTPVKSR